MIKILLIILILASSVIVADVTENKYKVDITVYGVTNLYDANQQAVQKAIDSGYRSVTAKLNKRYGKYIWIMEVEYWK